MLLLIIKKQKEKKDNQKKNQKQPTIIAVCTLRVSLFKYLQERIKNENLYNNTMEFIYKYIHF